MYFQVGGEVLKAIDGVSFQIRKREIVGLLGESGCGKTLTALSILRLIPPRGKIVGGEILFRGEDLVKNGDEEMRQIRGSQIAMIFQNPMTSLNPVYTIGDQIAEVFQTHFGDSKSAALQKAVERMEEVGIPDAKLRSKDYPHQFSGGMKQRSMTAMAGRPLLLIADEPTTALDVTIQAQILELMKGLRELGMSMLWITHDIGVVAELCDKVGVMYGGQIVEFADKRTILKAPLHPYTQGLLACSPSTHERSSSKLIQIPGQVPTLSNLPSGCKFHPRCSQVMEICHQAEPKLLEIEPGHLVRCHLYPGAA